MIKWPVRCTIIAVALQCIGCAADTLGNDIAETGTPTEIRNDARQEGLATRPDIHSIAAPAMRPTPLDVQKARYTGGSPYLPTESALIQHGGISGDRSIEMLEDTTMFAKALERMRADERTSLEAQALARHHGNVLQRAVGSQGVVEDLTCGLSLCLGAVTARSEADHDAWHDRLVKDPAARRYGAVHRHQPVGDQLQQRFVFSADPAVAAIYMDR